MSKPFHLAMFMSFSPPDWRSTWAGNAANEFWTGKYHVDMAKQMENAGFSYLFFADFPYMSESWGNSLETTLKYPLPGGPMIDPFTAMTTIAMETEHIGLVATGSTTFYTPFLLARLVSTLDHLTAGRVGWNVVTSSGDLAAQNYGFDKLIEHDERYAMAEEFIEVCKELWDSWEPGAIIQDRERGYYADYTKVHKIDHVGKYWKSRGPLTHPAGPQGHPVICQAGGSDAGRGVAARTADVVVATNPRVPYLKEYVEDIRGRAAAAGRDPQGIKVMFQVSPVVGETDEAARELHRTRFVDNPETAVRVLAMMSGGTGHDFSQYDLDDPFPQDIVTNGHQSIIDDMARRNKGRTLRESIVERAQFGPEIVGSPATCAERMEEIIEETGGDGFLFMFPTTRRYIDEVCSGLAPELRRRGLLQQDYRHKTFKDNLLAF